MIKLLFAEGRVEHDQERPLFGSHPVYQFLAGRYRLNIHSVYWEPDVIPGISDIKALKETREAHPASWMLWEEQPDEQTIEVLAARGIKSLVFNPCANRPKSSDFLTVMRQNLDNLARALGH